MWVSTVVMSTENERERPRLPAARPAAAREARARDRFDSTLGFRIGRVHRLLRISWERRLSDLGLSPPQAAMLRAIGECPGLGLREIGRRLCTDAMNAKRLADHLELAGLVRSTADPAHTQRRLLVLTEQGLSLAGNVLERADAQSRHLSALLGGEELEHLLEMLARLDAALAEDGSCMGGETKAAFSSRRTR